MIKVAAVSYLNTLPFIYGLEQSKLIKKIDLHLNYPAICAKKLLKREVDLALVPVVILPYLQEYHMITDYCIGANGSVETVCLYSNVPIQKVTSIFLDYQSKTSVALLKILLKEYWFLNPELKSTRIGFEKKIVGSDAALVIGDRAFDLNAKYRYIYDLANIWKQMTGLPFVFATWISHAKLSESFVLQFNKALTWGLANVNDALELNVNYSSCKNPKHYLDNKISYNLDAEKLEGMNLFLKKI